MQKVKAYFGNRALIVQYTLIKDFMMNHTNRNRRLTLISV